ncbi:MAG TPA: 50S ribosomal protein L11 methyltransferase [Solirubrobacteraceae bacterium]|nr:50S ribosomal protein L11 methyltransferase [Solirubrobacteraceae bacterium]
MIRLAVRVARADAEVALAGLLDLVPAGLEEIDRPDGTVEFAVYRPAGGPPDPAAVRAALGAVVLGLSSTTVADDWAERWREFHRPSRVGDRLWVRAPWEPPAASGLIDIEIEPAQAFGTGSHPTTRLCLGLLLALVEAGEAAGPLLDIGCGSGVLAIAAAKLGWSPVAGLDHEAESVAATRANAAANAVAVDARHADILVERPPSAPVVTANLLAPLLVGLAARMTGRPRHLIAGGLTPDQADEVVAAFARHRGLGERERRHESGWTALHLIAADARPAPAARPLS